MEKNPYQMAIEGIDACARIYKIHFQITRSGKYITVGKNHGKWIVTVMKERFVDKDFVKAAGDAVTFVYKAFENNQPH